MHNCCPAESSSNGCRLKHFEHANKAEDSPDEADSRDDFDLDDDIAPEEEEDTERGRSGLRGGLDLGFLLYQALLSN